MYRKQFCQLQGPFYQYGAPYFYSVIKKQIKIMELTQEQKLFQEIIQEAWGNAEFKKNLVANPVVAIENFTGRKLNIPEGKTLVVRDQTDESTVYINIPAQQLGDVELNEEQLELVSGGIGKPYMGIRPFDLSILSPKVD